MSPSEAAPGGRLTVKTDTLVASFSMIRFGTTTHTVNTDQWRIALSAVPLGTVYVLPLPSDPGIMLPGYWMLFAMSSGGVPSHAATIKIT